MGFLCFLICVSVAMLRSKSKGLDGNLRIPVIQPCAPGHDQFFLNFPCWKSVLADVILFLLVQCCEMFLRLFLYLQFSVQFPQVIAHRIIELRRDLRISLVRMLLPKIWHHTRLVNICTSHAYSCMRQCLFLLICTLTSSPSSPAYSVPVMAYINKSLQYEVSMCRTKYLTKAVFESQNSEYALKFFVPFLYSARFLLQFSK